MPHPILRNNNNNPGNTSELPPCNNSVGTNKQLNKVKTQNIENLRDSQQAL